MAKKKLTEIKKYCRDCALATPATDTNYYDWKNEPLFLTCENSLYFILRTTQACDKFKMKKQND